MNEVVGAQIGRLQRCHRLIDESGSILPLTLAGLLSLTMLMVGLSAAGELLAIRMRANSAAYALAVRAAGAALAGVDACFRARESAGAGSARELNARLASCLDTGSEIELIIEVPLGGPLTHRIAGSVRGGARVGYGGGLEIDAD